MPLRSLQEVSDELHSNNRAVRGKIKEHNIPVIKIGRSILFDDVAFDALKEALRQGCSAEPVSYHGRRRGSDFERALRLTTVPKRRRDLTAVREASAALERAEAVLERAI